MTFPRTILEFQKQFSSKEACWHYLTKVRWPDGFICPRCGLDSVGFITTRGLWQCAQGHQTSVTSETVMYRSHLPLPHWFWAAYLVTTQTPGISAMVLSRQLGVGYETAYMILQRLRAGMVNPARSKLKGAVEVDEAYISAGSTRAAKRKAGRGTSKPMVIAAVENMGKTAGRVRLRRIGSATEENIRAFITDHVEPGSTIITDGLNAYANVSRWGYKHVVRVGENSEEVAKQLVHVHRVFSNLKAWLVGTHRGVSSKHLQGYLNEYTFRYNRRGNPQAAFLAVLGISAHRAGPTYEGIYSAGEPPGWIHPNPTGSRRLS